MPELLNLIISCSYWGRLETSDFVIDFIFCMTKVPRADPEGGATGAHPLYLAENLRK